MIPDLGTLPSGTRGFDVNEPVSRSNADKMFAAGYRFAIRYVRRGLAKDNDIHSQEVIDILQAGLGLMLVQHVAMPGWVPGAKLGQSYGAIAANEAALIGYPINGMIWLDLEGVKSGTPHQQIIDYCNEWWDAVSIVGYTPGIYIGDSSGLSPNEMYLKLKFKAYWSAYNLNRDEFPAVRGVQMKQLPYPGRNHVPGIPFEYDEDEILLDKMGDTPLVLLPGCK